MKQLISIALIVFALNFSSAQEVYLNVGRNFTTYDYTTLKAKTIQILNLSGASYEVGYIFPMGDKFGIAAVITLDQFNATGGNLVNNYSWNTNYLGLQGIKYFYRLLNAGINFIVKDQTFKLTGEEVKRFIFKLLPGLMIAIIDLVVYIVTYKFNNSIN